jgi:plasmid stabilization system protein ParE
MPRRARIELAPGLRALPIGARTTFYLSIEDGVDRVRVLGGAMDIRSGSVTRRWPG